jgi:uncharacterized protein (DUF58 family)
MMRPRELPEELLRHIEFKILKRLDGFFFGDYTGVFYGPSLDLAEVREYQPGDEVRRIDWNVTARTGKVHVRQYREEREITAWLVVDLSPSMNFGTKRVLKRNLALEFAGTASSIITRHGDKIGAVGVSDEGMKIVLPGSSRKQALQVLRGLIEGKIAQPLSEKREAGSEHSLPGTPSASRQDPEPGTLGTLAAGLEQVSKTLKRRALVFVVSDFLDEMTWTNSLRRLAYRHDVIAVRVSDPAEIELPKAGELRFRDPETGEEAWIDTSDPKVRTAYTKMVLERDEKIRYALRAAQVELLELSTANDIIQPIMKFSLQRKGRR